MGTITPIKMPKWGLSMTEGSVTHWWKAEGDPFQEGEDLVDIETSKINNTAEAPFSGRLRRILAHTDDVAQVGALIAVAADEDVSDAEIDAYVAEFQSTFVPEAEGQGEGGGLAIQTVVSEGRSVRAGVVGDLGDARTPTVLIHGFAGDLNNWLFNLQDLAQLGPVVVAELPGHGASNKSVQRGDLGELSTSVLGVLDTLGIKHANLVGHSLGAAVALRLTLDAPDRVRGLILIAPASLPGSETNAEFLSGVVEAQSARQLTPVLAQLFADESLVTRDMVEDMLRYKRLDGSEDALDKIRVCLTSGDDASDLRNRLASAPPASVILGAHDRIVGAPNREDLPSTWRVHELAAGHMPHMEQAASTNKIILEALSDGA